MRKRKKELRIRVDEGIHNSLKGIAREEGRTVSELVREAVAMLIRQREREKVNETLDSIEKRRGN